ncbi:hypothetical protein [Methylobacterium fujisawaense]|uniref:hypothetical protein n=1 Tax=Methylobacterium fujisawaense TaxID=107400 RepID=UPI0024490BD7|nr:hypothetical protein [Methylobacterium fujisawaense]MDH3031451.1 hypothetical protein [Methylobacterium fujisawaense]
MKRNNNPVTSQGPKLRRASQDAEIRHRELAEYDDALATLGRIEATAGPTLQEELGRAKRVQAAFKIGQDRQAFVRRRLGQRSGLLRLLRAELGDDPAFDDRSRIYVRHMLMISANVAAVTGSSWKSSLKWFLRSLPSITDHMAILMEGDFVRYVESYQIELAKRAAAGDPNQLTGPSPAEIAEALGTTTVQLRAAQANTCGLTSIDPQDPKVRDRERKAKARERAGMQKQSVRNAKAEMQALADSLGCSLRTLYRRRKIDAASANDNAVTKMSVLDKEIDVGQFGDTPANDECKVARTA